MSASSRRINRRRFLGQAGATAGLVAGSAWLAGCAPTQPTTSAPAKPAAAPTSAPAAAAAPAAPAKPAASANPLKIGFIQPYTGVYALLGENSTNGMQLYLDSVNNSAGGRAVTLIKEDEGTPDDALRKARKLIEQDNVDLVVGIVSSASALAVRDLFHDTKNILVITTAGANDVTRGRRSPYVFRVSYNNYQIHAPMGEYLFKNVGKRFVASGADYAAGRETVAAFKQNFLAAGGELLGELYPPFPNTDYAPYLTQIQQLRPDGSFSFYAGSDAVNFVKQWGEFGLNRDLRLCGSGFMIEEDTLPAQGQAALRGLTALHWASTLDNPENRAFVQAYQQKYSKEPDVYALHGYDAGRVVVEALNRVQGDTTNKDRLSEAIATVKFASARGPFEFDTETHNVVQNVYVRETREVNGKLTNVVLETFPLVRDTGA